MEELRSTEVLDREIETDARKKAERILSKADLDGKTLLDGVAARVASVKAEKEAEYRKRIEAFRKNEDAALPLEKERFRVSFVESAMISAINGYFEKLSDGKCLELIMSHYGRYTDVIGSRKVNASVFGLKTDEVKKLLVNAGVNLGKCENIEYEKSGDDPVKGLTVKKGVILETEDRQTRCRLTISEIVAELESGRRAELASILFDGRLS